VRATTLAQYRAQSASTASSRSGSYRRRLLCFWPIFYPPTKAFPMRRTLFSRFFLLMLVSFCFTNNTTLAQAELQTAIPMPLPTVQPTAQIAQAPAMIAPLAQVANLPQQPGQIVPQHAQIGPPGFPLPPVERPVRRPDSANVGKREFKNQHLQQSL